MNTAPAGHRGLEALLAKLLHYGTWLSSGVIALGLVLPVVDPAADLQAASGISSTQIVALGIALLILLPVLRVVLMLVVFLRERDYRLSAVAGLVLAVILLGFVIGLAMTEKDSPVPERGGFSQTSE